MEPFAIVELFDRLVEINRSFDLYPRDFSTCVLISEGLLFYTLSDALSLF